MTYKTVEDVLDFARQLHETLSRQYSHMERRGTSERARLILDYLARHERDLAEALHAYEQDAANRLLCTWLQYAPRLDSGPLLEKVRGVDLNDVEAVVAAALAIDDHLLAVYREIEDQADIEPLREIARNLQQMERSEQQLLARDAQQLRDV